MTTDLCADIASYLIAQGQGVTLSTYLSSHTGTPICYGYLPDAPLRCTTVYQFRGTDPVATHDNASDIRQPGLQVMVRSDDYDEGTTRINAIYALLHKNRELTLNGTRYVLLWAEQDFISLGWYDDGAGRALKIVQNFRIMRSG